MNSFPYDRFPFVGVPDSEGTCVAGWTQIAIRLERSLHHLLGRKRVVVVDCYVGSDEAGLIRELGQRLQPVLCIAAAAALRSTDQIEALVAPYLGGDDPVFGRMAGLELRQFFDPAAITACQEQIKAVQSGLVLIVGCGARLFARGDLLVYADLARWEIQLRQRRNESGSFGGRHLTDPPARKYKRAYFVDWRVCDRWKQPLMAEWDFLLDLNQPAEPKLAEGEAVRRGLRHAVSRPFRVVPFFDPAPWGGQWLKHMFQLDPAAQNYGWGFDCVPEENSLLLQLGGQSVELPALDLVLDQPEALLGPEVFRRFGAEFPIRFDLLDTMGGGNLSFQVHPLRDYIEAQFGLTYTQDESYYLLDAGPGARVYLGLREGVAPSRVQAALRTAQAGGAPFAADEFAESWPAHKHDHFLIPAGTPHCSGAESVVLEISATPYIFTFKLWDWGRLGLDGKPRPIHLEHGFANVQWDRTADWTRQRLVNHLEPCGSGPGWREERTGLDQLQFIETRRHWFTERVPHDTAGNLNVLNLVEGAEIVVESPSGAFEPFVVHYAETFIVPAAVGAYTIRPTGAALGRRCATLKAYVRTA